MCHILQKNLNFKYYGIDFNVKILTRLQMLLRLA